MKKIIIATALLITLFATVALAANNVELQAKHVGDPGVWKYTTTVGFGEQISQKWGWTGFILSSTTWSEAYLGPTFKPVPWITVATCAGIQDDPQKSRFAAWAFVSRGKLSGLYIKETGAGDSHKLLVSYTTSFGKIHLWNQTNIGIGPRVEVKLPGQKTRASAYVGLMFDDGTTNSAIGIIKSF